MPAEHPKNESGAFWASWGAYPARCPSSDLLPILCPMKPCFSSLFHPLPIFAEIRTGQGIKSPRKRCFSPRFFLSLLGLPVLLGRSRSPLSPETAKNQGSRASSQHMVFTQANIPQYFVVVKSKHNILWWNGRNSATFCASTKKCRILLPKMP